MKRLRDYHVISPHQDHSWSCGPYSVRNAMLAKCKMKDIKADIDIERILEIWNKPKQGFLLPLINSVKQFEGKNINGIEMFNIMQGKEESIGKYVDHLVTPVIAISFGGRNRYKGKMAYTEMKGRTRKHIVCVIDEVDGDLKLSDSAYGDIAWIRKKDRSIIKDVVYFNCKGYIPQVMEPLKKKYRVSQFYGENPKMYKKYKMRGHNGIDYATPEGTPVYASFDGVTIVKDSGEKGYGLHIRIINKDYEAVYGHLRDVFVQDGETVRQGTSKLGDTGNSGFSTGPHLHYGIRNLDKGEIRDKDNGFFGYKDPLNYFG